MGNILRSVLTEKLFNRKITERKLNDSFKAISRGVQGSSEIKPSQDAPSFDNIMKYPEVWKIQEPLLKELDVDFSDKVSQSVDSDVLGKAALIVVMDKKAYDLLVVNFPSLKGKILLRNIDDAGDSHDRVFHERHNNAIVNMVEEDFDEFLESSEKRKKEEKE